MQKSARTMDRALMFLVGDTANNVVTLCLSQHLPSGFDLNDGG